MVYAVVLISANAEWRIVLDFYQEANLEKSPFGDFFEKNMSGRRVIFMHGGWGKIAAAASTQYAIDRWQPVLLVNLGTCGGFAGRIERGTLLLVERTLVYDIIEQMGDPQAAIEHYTVDLDLSWLGRPYPQEIKREQLVSADRDLCPEDIPLLIDHYEAVAGDWESGAIAWVAHRNGIRCLILRGVSDLVGEQGGEAYDAIEIFHTGTRQVMLPILEAFPKWLDL